jgi:glycosyltransferase involved in cell wall biosynthesis
MVRPLVSAVVPTYNRPTGLREAVRSIDEQTYDNLEVVIVDDGSDHKYAKSVADESTDCRQLSIREHDENRGVSAARNTGIDASSGEYVAFLDDDDVWKETKIEKQIDVMLEEGRSVSYTWLERVDENGNVTGESKKTSSGVIRTEVPNGGFPGPPAVCIKKSVFEDIGGFRESLEVLEDTEFGIRLADNYEYSCVPETLVMATSLGHPSRKYVTKKQRATENFLEWHTPLPERFGSNATTQLRSRLYRSLGITALKAETYGIARRSLFQSIRADPAQKRSYLYLMAAIGNQFTHKPLLLLKTRLLDDSSA